MSYLALTTTLALTALPHVNAKVKCEKTSECLRYFSYGVYCDTEKGQCKNQKKARESCTTDESCRSNWCNECNSVGFYKGIYNSAAGTCIETNLIEG
ncbi:hypothetical protein VTN00DRAFT_3244 [Thermoascus crustaceus]|uniref:uncharacterized protein n=1 Tax=Thermoascus crustaceus TaxID=5088 RepID=UPI00374306E3